MHYFDVRGVLRVLELQIDEAGWSMVRVDPDFSQRFTARFEGPDAMEANGQYSDDGGTTWHDDFTMSCRRIG